MNSQSKLNRVPSYVSDFLPFKAVLLIFILLFSYNSGISASIFTAIKTCPATGPCTTTNQGISFAIATAQTVRWTATYLGYPSQGNDFYLTTDLGNLIQIPLSTNLSSGMNTGTVFLAPGNYFISIQSFFTGPGSYSIEYDFVPDCNIAPPTSFNFGNHDAGTTGADHPFTINLAGDMLDVQIGAISGTDNAHFVVTGGTGTTLRSGGPTSVTFNVHFQPGSTSGTFSSTITIVTTSPAGLSVPDKSVTVTGTTVPLLPNIDCLPLSTVDLDYLVTTTRTFNKSFENEGNAPLTISSISLGANPSGVFSLNGAPSTANLASGSSRGVSIRFTPPAMEGTYTGSIIINSNSPGETTKECTFTARAHHPEPNMEVTIVPDGGLTANYRDVEIGFTYTKGVKVLNTGDAPLNLTLNMVNTSDPDIPQWSEINEPDNVTIAAGSEQVFLQRFKPITVGSYTIEISALGTGGGGTYNRTETIQLIGNGINPIPMDNVLVLDRSGSMSENAGSRTKIDALQKAARIYYDLLRTDPGDGSGDKIGMVKYNSSSQYYLSPIQIKNTANEPNVLDLLSEASTTNSSRLQPNGGTCISCGMTAGANELLASPDSRKQVMVVMTDGLETAGAPVTDAFLNNLQTANPDIMIYSLGLGDDINETLLQSITNAGTGGYHHVSENLIGNNHFALEEFYFKIYANASGADLVVDPTKAINISSGSPVEVNRAHIVSSDRSATFLVLDDPALSSYYKLEFIDPNGTILDPTVSVGGIPIQILKRAGHTVYKIIFPDISQSPKYVGDWILRLNPTGKWKKDSSLIKVHKNYNINGEWIHPYEGLVPIGFGAAVKSDYNMRVSVTANNYQPGAHVLLTAELSDRGWPSIGGHIELTATKPDESNCNFKLFDDGTHGDTQADDGVYINTFNQTAIEGTYRFFFNGKGINERGEQVQRQATQYLSLMNLPKGDTSEVGICLPCWAERLKIWLLFLILALVAWCCRKEIKNIFK